MKIKNLFQQIRNRFNPQPEMTDEVAVKFLKVLEQARAEDWSCTDIYARLDEFVENELKGVDAERIAPLIHEHLDICNECCEEYEALLAVVENTKGQEIDSS
ncbi:MAG: hypothetical protein DPW18_09750 [Chloroflexi bacterium]|nr:MAG: hypothetical protein EDM79_06230 [Chloroflexota bacterium]MCQ3937318.1 hypothetical protein [Chloroflexota bacterium]MDL1943755.1 hypothetical protein [Chloroflexi bacterium CFX2]